MLKDDSLFLNQSYSHGLCCISRGISQVVDWDWTIFLCLLEGLMLVKFLILEVPRAVSVRFQESSSKVPKIRLFWDALWTSVARVGVTKGQKLVSKLCNLTKTALFICFWMCFYFLTNMYIVFIALLVRFTHCVPCYAGAAKSSHLVKHTSNFSLIQ